ncbi:Gltx1p, partial [Friedmanniomyces endolithicus]
MPVLKVRAADLNELAANAAFFFRSRPLPMDDGATALLTPEARAILSQLHAKLDALAAWDTETIEAAVREVAEAAGLKLGAAAQPLRAALTGSRTSPGIFD